MTALTELEVDGRFEHGQVVLNRQPALPEGAQLLVRISVQQPKMPRKLPREFFELTAGTIPEMERPPQGEYEVRESLE